MRLEFFSSDLDFPGQDRHPCFPKIETFSSHFVATFPVPLHIIQFLQQLFMRLPSDLDFLECGNVFSSVWHGLRFKRLATSSAVAEAASNEEEQPPVNFLIL